MARIRISTTVDAELLAGARALRADCKDHALFDEALAALLAENRAAELDDSYRAYDTLPVDEPDAWGALG
ncbi:antitoxin MazE5 [Mycobacterium sp.]|uniref:antitoxin MazE5 n=1 Tax=Mycobacterium sp. TaxID=1785 RepID=UPI0025F4AB8E|nr:antitoxin MazE5 [Mycobacterium sp.]